MSKHSQSLAPQWFLRVGSILIFGLLLLARIDGYGQTPLEDTQNALLQGSIQIQPLKTVPGDQTDKIQPGTPVKISVIVENKGQQAMPSGELYVRYAFPQPLEKEETSVIFETEKQTFPSIEAGKKIEIVFDNAHQIPSVLDFVRYDWSMREYQAIVAVNKKENLIGTLAITFSAYYYPGIKKEILNKISLPRGS